MQPAPIRRLFILLLALCPSTAKASADTNAVCNSTKADERFRSLYNLTSPPEKREPRPFLFEKLIPNPPEDGIDTEEEQFKCVTDPWSFKNTLALSYEGCKNMTGGEWHNYPKQDILGRLHSWKGPLVVLIFLMPRAPLGKTTWGFTLLHLCGDPVDTIASLLYTLAVCRTRAGRLRRRTRGDGNVRGLAKEDWKVIVMQISGYHEIGNDKAADELEKLRYIDLVNNHQELTVPECCKEKARALAADRSTSVAAVLISECVFAATYGVSFVYATTTTGPGHWSVVEIHSLAFSLTMLWIIMAIPLACAIGVSQSEKAIERIIRRLEVHQDDCPIKFLPSWGEIEERNIWHQSPPIHYRMANGGIPSWRPDKWTNLLKSWKDKSEVKPARLKAAARTPVYCLNAVFIVFFGTAAAWAVSAVVPPAGRLSCRQRWQGMMLLSWLGSFIFEVAFSLIDEFIRSRADRRGESSDIQNQIAIPLMPLSPQVQPQTQAEAQEAQQAGEEDGRRRRFRFWASLLKDKVATAANICIIMSTQWGILNKCDCWRRGDMVVLPQYLSVVKEMRQRSYDVFPALIFGSVGLQVLFAALAAWYYRDAIRVYLQTDDGKGVLDRPIGWARRVSEVVLSPINSRERRESERLLPTDSRRASNTDAESSTRANRY